MFMSADEDESNYVAGDELITIHTACFESSDDDANNCWFDRNEPTIPAGQTIDLLAYRSTSHRAGPNITAGDKDYDGDSTYVTGGVPIIYTPLINDLCNDCDVIYQVYNPANVRRTLAQGLNATNLVWTTGGDGGWFAQFYESHDGDSAAKASRIDAGESTWLETTVTGLGDLTFWWKVETEFPQNTLTVTLNGQTVSGGSISGSQGWVQKTINIPTNGAHTLRWTYQNNGGNTANFVEGVWIDEVVWNIPVPLAVDQPQRTWTQGTGAALPWFGQAVVTHDGLHAAQSGGVNVVLGGSTWVETDFAGPGSVSFWWKISAEQDHDFLRVAVDGNQQASAPQISGEVDWQQRKISIPAGTHAVRWTYEQDGNANIIGDNAAWLDEVVFTSNVVSNTSDSGPGSLRDAIASSAAGSTITFDPSLDGQTITLATGLVIDEDLTIDASALPNGLTLSGNGVTRVLKVPVGRSVSLNGLTIVDGVDSNPPNGSGLWNQGTTTISNSTFSGNEGAILNSFNATLTLLNTTISGNNAIYNSAGGLGNRGTATLIHATITNNDAPFYGGGIWHLSGTLHIENSIIAGNTTPNPAAGPDIHLDGPTITQAGANLIGNNLTVESIFPVSAPLVGEPGNVVDPLLGALQDNGGPTQTHIPLLGSPAIDRATGSLPATDQRGVPRVAPLGDIGAVEVDTLVRNMQDSGIGSLRQAIAEALPGATITFDPSLNAAIGQGQAIVLTSGQLLIDKDLTIEATGMRLALDGNGASRVFEIGAGTTVALRGLLITGGAMKLLAAAS